MGAWPSIFLLPTRNFMETNPSQPLKLVIVGGVAAGASTAARARRLSETAEITLLERGPDVSFANCGLPYYIGGEISRRDALAVQTPQTLRSMLNLEVRTLTEAIAIDRAGKRLQVRDTASGETHWLAYDKLVLAPGATPLRPPLPGIEHPRILTLRNLHDMDRIKELADKANRVAVIGAGFIGLEVAEQLRHLGKMVTLVEMLPQVLPQMDPKMTLLIEAELRDHGVELILGDGIASFAEEGNQVVSHLQSGRRVPADLVLLSIGVRPDSGLARAAGLTLGPRGHIQVNDFQQTSDPAIYAAGDAVETIDLVSGDPTAVALGGPANRQGRIIADHIFRPAQARPYPGSLGTAIVRVFQGVAAVTGWTEKRLRQAGRDFRTVTVNDNHHAGYFPGAVPLTLKVCYDPADGRLLGAQATGVHGVDKRIDVLATAITGGLTIDDLCHLELAYAPPFGAAKDIVNLAGFVATNWRDGLVELVSDLPADPAVQVVDVRPKALAEKHPLPGALNVPFPTLRENLHRLDASRPVVTACAFGKTSYFAARILAEHGFQVTSWTGGLRGNVDPRSPAKLPTP